MNEELAEVVRVMDVARGWDLLPHDDAFLARSIERILAATGTKTTAAYGGYISENSTEAENFSRTLNITYSEFFRNPLTVVAMKSSVERTRTFAPKRILMDLSLPVMDGFKALEAVRNEATVKHFPVIAVTASAMKCNREEILIRGFNDCISKPIDRAMLEGTIREHLYESEQPHNTGD